MPTEPTKLPVPEYLNFMTSLLRNEIDPRMFRRLRSKQYSRRSITLTITVIVVLYTAGTILAVVSTERSASALTSVNPVSTLAGGESEINELEDRLAVFDYRFRRLRAWIAPGRWVGKVLSPVPPIGRQVRGVDLLMERVELNHDAATSAVALARASIVLQETVRNGILLL